ncbi:MAG: peptide chain release factor N(5)-glutamine methyltransferase [Oscillospiraceae bacterium]
MTVREISERLKKSGIADYCFEAQQIAAFSKDENEVERIILRREKKEPLQYIFETWEFFSLEFKVSPAVLIPRADTEVLVEKALEFLKTVENAETIDLCSGSGCIAISVEKNSQCRMTALEKSPQAFEVLKQNLCLNKCKAVVVLGDVFDPPFGEYDLVLSNPPYIRSEELASLQAEVKMEPQMALDGGADGLRFFRGIVDNWSRTIKNGGRLMMEIGFDQATEVVKIFKDGGLHNIEVIRDYGGNDRVIVGTVIR